MHFCTHKHTCLDSNCTRMLWAVLNKSWRQHPIKQQLFDHLPPILQTIQIRQTKHAGHCWKNKDELISDVLLWTPSHGWAGVERPARIYLQWLSTGTGCSMEDLLRAMNAIDKWQEKVREIHASSMPWWLYIYIIHAHSNIYIYIYIYIYIHTHTEYIYMI